MQILGLFGMYFDAVVVEVEKYIGAFFQIGSAGNSDSLSMKTKQNLFISEFIKRCREQLGVLLA